MLTHGISAAAGGAGVGLVLLGMRDPWNGRKVSLWKLATGTTLLVVSSWMQAVHNQTQWGFVPFGATDESINAIDKEKQLSQNAILRWARTQVPSGKASAWLKTLTLQGHPVVIVGENHDSPVDMRQVKRWIANQQAALFCETVFRDTVFERVAKQLLNVPENSLVFGIEGVHSLITDYIHAAADISQDLAIWPHIEDLAGKISDLSYVADFWSDFYEKKKDEYDFVFLLKPVMDSIVDVMRKDGWEAGMKVDISRVTSPEYAQTWVLLFMLLAQHAVEYFPFPSDVGDAVLGYLDEPLSEKAWQRYYDKVNIEFRDRMIVESILEILPMLPKELPVIIRIGGDHVVDIEQRLKKYDQA